MDDGSGVSVSSRSQKFCEHFVSVKCQCSQNAHKMLTNAHKVLTKFCERHRKSSEAIRQIFTKNPGLSCELILFQRLSFWTAIDSYSLDFT